MRWKKSWKPSKVVLKLLLSFNVIIVKSKTCLRIVSKLKIKIKGLHIYVKMNSIIISKSLNKLEFLKQYLEIF